MTNNEAVALVAILRAAYPGQPFPNETSALYIAELTPLPAKETAEQVRSLIRRARRWPPSIGEIVEPVTRSVIGIPEPGAAWLEVEKNVRRCQWRQHHGWEPEPDWSHPLVAKVVRGLGGLEALQATRNVSVERSQFTKLYAELCETFVGETLSAPQVALPAPAERQTMIEAAL